MRTEISYLFVAVALSGLVVYPWDLGDMGLDPRLRPFAALFGFLWTRKRAVVFWKAWRRWRSWRLPITWSVKAEDLPIESSRRWMVRPLAKDFYSCLPLWAARWIYPDRGILLGRAFRWSPEHTQQLETHLQKGQPLPVGRDMRGGYPALHAVGKKEEQPLVLPWSELVGHVLIGGTTRSGKTRLLEVILSEAIRGPGTVIVIDPKGDAELLIRASVEAHRSGRKFALFSPAHPDQSASFNPFSMCDNTTELAARVQALMPGGGGMAKGDPFFTEYPLAVVERLGAAQDAVGDDWTIEGLHAGTTMVPPFDDLVSRYLYDVLGGRDNRTPSLEELIEEYTRKRGEK
ncbi:MAG: type IV secretory system conjugative DNA transfer family protein, partial [Rhodospirillaceae bacterium]|nr:type IV secretory system conjugative DNA transfer family protein [Rhodospirillaceae bacterium]